MSVLLDWAEIKRYSETVGPGRGRPARPQSCSRCDGRRVWFDGWRQVFPVVLVEGLPWRFDDGLWLQRAKCGECHVSWVLRPAWLYPHRSLEPDVAESAAHAYLRVPEATYRAVASVHLCSARSVWRWVGWAATLASPAWLVSEAVRLQSEASAALMIPRAVPQSHPKARSDGRAAVLLTALQVLVAMFALSRAQPHPPDDPSALRWWLTDRFLRFRQVATLIAAAASPAVPHPARGPPR